MTKETFRETADSNKQTTEKKTTGLAEKFETEEEEKNVKVSASENAAKEIKVKKQDGGVIGKDVAIANGVSLRASPKQCIYICKIIRGKSPDDAIARLQDVVDGKKSVPMADLEVGHKKGAGIAGGRFPKNACRVVMNILKQVKANAVVAGIENPVISVVKSNSASAPFRRGGRKSKRVHVHVEVRDGKSLMVNGKSGKKKQGGKFVRHTQNKLSEEAE